MSVLRFARFVAQQPLRINQLFFRPLSSSETGTTLSLLDLLSDENTHSSSASQTDQLNSSQSTFNDSIDEDDESAVDNEVNNYLDSKGRVYSTGRRKTSSARVWIKPGQGMITVNHMSMIDYFRREALVEEVTLPFAKTYTAGKFDVWCTVKGGGNSGQAGAVRHGISRCIEKFQPTLRIPLKRAGLLTRDARKVERKKAGQPKARKKRQWVKR